MADKPGFIDSLFDIDGDGKVDTFDFMDDAALFAMMREDLEEKGWTVNFSNYNAVSKHAGKAGDCVECGQCEEVCPQHLTIIEYLKDVAEHFEH